MPPQVERFLQTTWYFSSGCRNHKLRIHRTFPWVINHYHVGIPGNRRPRWRVIFLGTGRVPNRREGLSLCYLFRNPSITGSTVIRWNVLAFHQAWGLAMFRNVRRLGPIYSFIFVCIHARWAQSIVINSGCSMTRVLSRDVGREVGAGRGASSIEDGCKGSISPSSALPIGRYITSPS